MRDDLRPAKGIIHWLIITIVCFWLPLLIGVSAWGQVRVDTLITISDTYINANQPTFNHGLAGTMEIAGTGYGGGFNALIKFDISSLPSDLDVDSVKFGFWVSAGNTLTDSLRVKRITRDWAEGVQSNSPGVCNWDTASPGVAWTSAGGDYANPTYGGSAGRVYTSSSNDTVTISSELVQGWIDGTWDNYGMELILNTQNALITIFTKDQGVVSKKPTLWIYSHAQPSIAYTITDSLATSFAFVADTVSVFDSLNVVLNADSTVLGSFTDTTGNVTGLSIGTQYITKILGYSGGVITATSNLDTVTTLSPTIAGYTISDSSIYDFTFAGIDTTVKLDSIGIKVWEEIDSLKGFYPFDNTYSDFVCDSLAVPLNVSFTDGIDFKAAEFNGVGGSVVIGSHICIDDLFITGGSISLWIYPRSYGENGAGRLGTKVIHYAYMDSANSAISFYVKFSGVNGHWRAPIGDIFNSWHHLAITYDGSSVANNPAFYLDGVSGSVTEVSTPTGTIDTDVGQSLRLGGTPTNVWTFNGFLDEFKFYRRILTPAEVLKEYNSNKLFSQTFTDTTGTVTSLDASTKYISKAYGMIQDSIYVYSENDTVWTLPAPVSEWINGFGKLQFNKLRFNRQKYNKNKWKKDK